MRRKRIGVFPPTELAAKAALFDALESTLAVRFVSREAGDYQDLDAALVLPGGHIDDGVPLPRVLAVSPEGAAAPPPPLGRPPQASGETLDLAATPPLDRRLRGARLRDGTVSQVPPLMPRDGEVVLATSRRGAMWVAGATPDGLAQVRVAVAPDELDNGEALRDRLRNGRFLALAATVHFLRDVCGASGWAAPPLRACFIFDDPNLHWKTYGYLRYPELLREADRHGFHVALAMVPLDGWFASPAVASMFRDRGDRLSLVVHGNNHELMELARLAEPAQARALLDQALRRVAGFEQRYGVRVGRIMVPPHGVCSREIAGSLTTTGFDALCISRPFPWLARPPRPWLVHPEGSSSLAGWHPAQVIEGGLPVLLRRGMDDPVDDLALRAFLDQPLIIQGHHADVRGGVERLTEIAAMVNSLGDVQWQSLGDIAASNFTTLHTDDLLHVRMFTRRGELPIPEGVKRLRIEVSTLDVPSRDTIRIATRSAGAGTFGAEQALPAGASEELLVPDGTTSVSLRLVASAPASGIATEPPPSLHVRALARRVASEGRDRLMPAYDRAMVKLSLRQASS